MPWMPDEVTAVMMAGWAEGERDPTTLAVAALRAVYPVDPSGGALKWPTSPADCDAKRVLESRVILRAQRLVAEAYDIQAETVWYEGGGY